ncbi:ABC transporter ATP-binding protein [Brochothrix thermosphacta]|uniref:ABC transporter ATP-binding protein n=1 Tax=Brochothrix thermosphacta TaxID=2756 RepID=UPI00083FAB81|nr:ABC transporter ATP-binding protein [Brochothrix thermosphacta]ODJ54898.1 multidrug ABC transporter [Brochothrix thermosphacta]ODJ69759.1 multidrug ABC transporter [Brochothrix thermosphacta]
MKRNVLEITNLKKKYADTNVVNISKMTFEKGKMIGVLGPNGAGKSTLIKILMGLTQFDNGEVLYNGNTNLQKEILGLVPQDLALYMELNAYENLTFFGSLYNNKEQDLKQTVKQMIRKIGLEDKAKKTIKTYSGGMKRRVNIGAALIHNPEIIFMDEPTVGIDPQSRNKIYEIIEELKKAEKTIIYTTHYMEEVEKMCDYIYILDEGEIIKEGDLSTLLKQINNGVIEVVFADANVDVILGILNTYSAVDLVKYDDMKYTLLIKAELQVVTAELMSLFKHEDIVIRDFSFHKPNLETLFLLITGKTLRE